MRTNTLRLDTEWESAQTAVALDPVATRPVTVNRPVFGVACTRTEPQWVEPVRQRMSELATLTSNWDGRYSSAVRHDALSFAYSVLAQSMLPRTISPSIIPLGHGGVQLVWSNPTTEVEVEVIRPNDVVLYHHDLQSGDEDEWRTETEFSKLASLLKTTFTK
jgi:hypothetical protein